MELSWPYYVPCFSKKSQSETLFTEWNYSIDKTLLMRLVIFENDLIEFSPDKIPKEINTLQFKLFDRLFIKDNNKEEGEAKEKNDILSNVKAKRTLLLSAILNIPSNIHRLEIIGSCDKYILEVLEIAVLPPSITHCSLFIDNLFKLDVSRIKLPTTITHLSFSTWKDYNHCINNGMVIPESVTSLKVVHGSLDNTVRLSPSIVSLKVRSIESFDRVDSVQRFNISGKDHGNVDFYLGTLPSTKKVKYRLVSDYQSNIDLETYDGVYKVKRTTVHAIPTSTTKLLWETYRVPISIPSSVKSIVFGGEFNDPIPEGVIAESVDSIEFRGLNQCLSRIKLPSKLKHLILPPDFKQFIFGNKHIPQSVTFLEIFIEDQDVFRYLFSHLTIPRSVTHLKIHFEKEYTYSCYLPSSIKYISCSPSFYDKIFIVDQDLYYHRAEKEDPGYSVKSILKSIKISNGFFQTIEPNTLPSGLTQLQISSSYNKFLDMKTFPKSIKDMVFTGSNNIKESFSPDHQFNSLQYTLGHRSYNQIAFKGPISISDTLPNMYFIETGELLPVPSIPIDELQLLIFRPGSTLLPLTVNVRKLVLNSSIIPLGALPNSVKELVLYNCNIEPGTIPTGVEHLEFRGKTSITQDVIPPSVTTLKLYSDVKILPSCIPSSVKELTISLTESNLKLFDKKQDNHQSEKETEGLEQHPLESSKQNIKNNNHICKDNFLAIWKNKYLKQKIMEYYYISKVMFSTMDEFKNIQKLFKQQCLVCPKYLDLYDSILSNDCSRFVDLDSSLVTFKLTQYPSSITRLLKHCEPEQPFPSFLKLGNYDSIKSLTILSSLTAKEIKIPETISHLALEQSILTFEIPSTVKYLRLKENVSLHKLEEYLIPKTVSSISVHYRVFQKIPAGYKIPHSLISRIEGGTYEIYDPLKEISPKTTVLVWLANQVIPQGLIPSKVSRIIFGHDYNQIITKSSLPTTITHIDFGNSFSQNLDDVYIPHSVKYLSLGAFFNQSLQSKNIPPALSHISLYYNKFINIQHLPQSISHLNLYRPKQANAISNLLQPILVPKNVKHLAFTEISNIRVCSTAIESIYSTSNSSISILDEEAFDLQFEEFKRQGAAQEIGNNEYFSKSMIIHLNNTGSSFGVIKFNQFLRSNSLSSDYNIQSIDFGDFFNQYLIQGSIPRGVKRITFGDQYNQKIMPNTIPNTVTKICFGKLFNQPVSLPTSLKILTFGQEFNQPLDMLPAGLEELYLGTQFNQQILVPLSSNLRVLHFGQEFNYEIENDFLPDTIQELALGENYSKSLEFLTKTKISTLLLNCGYYSLINEFECIPDSVTKLSLGSTNNKHISTKFSADLIPPYVTDLTITDFQPIENLDLLSSNVSFLKIGQTFKGRIPPSVQHLELSDRFDLPLEYILPINK